MSIVSEALQRLDAVQAVPPGSVLPPQAAAGGARGHHFRGMLVGAGLASVVAFGIGWNEQADQRAAAPLIAAAPPIAAPAAIASPVRQTAAVAAERSDAPSPPPPPALPFPRSQSLNALLTPMSAELPLAGGAAAASWIEGGWAELRRGRVEGALVRWESGFEARGSGMTLLVAAVYIGRAALEDALGQLQSLPAVFALRAPYGDLERAYYVLAAADAATAGEIERQLKAVTGAQSLPRLTALSLLARMARMAPAAKAPPPLPAAAPAVAMPQRSASPPATTAPAGVAAASEPTAGASQAAHRAGIADSWESLDQRVLIALQAKDFAAAAQLAEQMTADWPGRAHSWLRHGTAALGSGRIEDAERSLEKALALDKSLGQAWLQRALIAQERQDHARALLLLGEAKNLLPEDPDIQLNLGISAQAMGNAAQAAVAYHTFMSQTEGKPKYAKLRAFVRQRLGE